jgi:hypothetical protein
MVWETARGLALTSLQLHVQFTRFDISLECSRILMHLTDNPSFPIICLHNSPAQYIKLPTYSAPARDVEGMFCYFSLHIYKNPSIIHKNIDRFTTRRCQTSSETSLEKGIVVGYVLVAEEVCTLDVLRDDGAS